MSKKAQAPSAAPVQQTVSLTTQVGNIVGLKKDEWDFIPSIDQLTAVQQQLARPASPVFNSSSSIQPTHLAAGNEPVTVGSGDQATSTTTVHQSNGNEASEEPSTEVIGNTSSPQPIISKATEEDKRLLRAMHVALSSELPQSLLFIYTKLYTILVKELKLTMQQTQIVMALFKYLHDNLQDVEGFKQKLFALHQLTKLKSAQYVPIINFAITGVFQHCRLYEAAKKLGRHPQPTQVQGV